MFELRRHTTNDSDLPTGRTELLSRHHTLATTKRAMKAAQKAEPRHPYFNDYYPRFVVVKPTTLQTSTGRLTNAYHLISTARHRNGVTVTKRQKGFSDYGDLMNLVTEGLLEIRNNGPRGGRTWHATRKGRRAVA